MNNLLDSISLCDIYGVNTQSDQYGTERTETAMLTYFSSGIQQTGILGD